MEKSSEYTPEQMFDDWLCDEFMDRFRLNKTFGQDGVKAVEQVLDEIIHEYRTRFNPWKE